ncbi:DUF4468 domain-containing protein [Marinimicrobium sp. ABcell2]|uniref:DUF4468 domain-containing protein n=1 Tax=Marinimicrobium sp. ABcell2 TaxID=3069751 RepID=UPI0027AF4C85|nr:DUF4468 domain-containing protein [Marinimicrobium sp. ABcell2]MDQ2077756.1 DUF4468 domain-containing protein [Marinimicrobium sp. ABcell2]
MIARLKFAMRFVMYASMMFGAILASGCATTGISEDNLQALTLDNGELEYNHVHSVDGVSDEELYDRAMQWMARNYRSANDVIQLEDRDGKRVIGKGAFSVPFMMITSTVRHTIQIDTRDGRYRLSIDGLRVVPDSGNEWNLADAVGPQRSIVSGTDKRVFELVNSLASAMSVDAAEDEW